MYRLLHFLTLRKVLLNLSKSPAIHNPNAVALAESTMTMLMSFSEPGRNRLRIRELQKQLTELNNLYEAQMQTITTLKTQIAELESAKNEDTVG